MAEVQFDPKYALVIHGASELNDRIITECIEAAKNLKEERSFVVFRFANALGIDMGALGNLAKFARERAEKKIHVALICKRAITQTVTSQGLNRLLPCYNDTKDLMAKVLRKEAAEEFETVIARVVAESFDVVCKIKPTIKSTYTRGLVPDPTMDVVGVVGVASVPFSGTFVLGFPLKTFLAVMSKYLGMEVTEPKAEFLDGAAELLNVITGHAKIPLNEKGFELKFTPPTAMPGKKLDIKSLSKNPVTQPSKILHFESPLGEFYFEMSVR